MKTAEINNVEILATGKWSGSRKAEVTLKDLEEMVQNFDKKVVDPWITLDHNDGYTNKVKNFLKVASLGWVSKLWTEGNKLMANFKEVPAQIAKLIDAGTLKKRSVEYYPSDTPYRVNGKDYKNLLTAVTFFGAGKPAVNSLADDFEVLMLANKSHAVLEGVTALQSKITEGDTMKVEEKEKLDEIKLLRNQIAKLKAAKVKLEAEAEAEDEAEDDEEVKVPKKGKGKMEDPTDEDGEEPDEDDEDTKTEAEDEAEESDDEDDTSEDDSDVSDDEKDKMAKYAMEAMSEAMEAMKKMGSKSKKEKAKYQALKGKYSKLVAFKARKLKAEAATWVDSQMQVGKILPRARDMAVDSYLRFKSEGKDSLALFKEDVENRPEATVLSEEYREISLKGLDPNEVESKKVNFKSNDEVDREIERLMKTDTKLDWMSAFNQIKDRHTRHMEGIQ